MGGLDLLNLPNAAFSLLSLCFILLQLSFQVLYLLLVLALLVFISGNHLFPISIESLLSIVHLLSLLWAWIVHLSLVLLSELIHLPTLIDDLFSQRILRLLIVNQNVKFWCDFIQVTFAELEEFVESVFISSNRSIGSLILLSGSPRIKKLVLKDFNFIF